MTTKPHEVLVVGGGAAGVITAATLLRDAATRPDEAGVAVTIVERSEVPRPRAGLRHQRPAPAAQQLRRPHERPRGRRRPPRALVPRAGAGRRARDVPLARDLRPLPRRAARRHAAARRLLPDAHPRRGRRPGRGREHLRRHPPVRRLPHRGRRRARPGQPAAAPAAGPRRRARAVRGGSVGARAPRPGRRQRPGAARRHRPHHGRRGRADLGQRGRERASPRPPGTGCSRCGTSPNLPARLRR